MSEKYRSEDYTIDGEEIRVWKVDVDSNGNTRYVVHWLSVAPELGDMWPHVKYDYIVNMLRPIGAKKYRAKWFGGGIVVQTYDIEGWLREALRIAAEVK